MTSSYVLNGLVTVSIVVLVMAIIVIIIGYLNAKSKESFTNVPKSTLNGKGINIACHEARQLCSVANDFEITTNDGKSCVTYNGLNNPITIEPCNAENDKQKWNYDVMSRKLISSASENACLDVWGGPVVEGGELRTYKCHDNENQKFDLNDFQITPSINNKLCMDVTDGFEDGAELTGNQLRLATCTSFNNQLFVIRRNGSYPKNLPIRTPLKKPADSRTLVVQDTTDVGLPRSKTYQSKDGFAIWPKDNPNGYINVGDTFKINSNTPDFTIRIEHINNSKTSNFYDKDVISYTKLSGPNNVKLNHYTNNTFVKSVNNNVLKNVVQSDNDYKNIKQQGTGKCFDGDGNKFYMGPCGASNKYQLFKVEKGLDSENFIMRHKASGKCVDSDGSRLYFGPCQSPNPHQNFKKNGDMIVHKKSGNCLDSDGKKAYLYPCNHGSNWHKWNFVLGQ